MVRLANWEVVFLLLSIIDYYSDIFLFSDVFASNFRQDAQRDFYKTQNCTKYCKAQMQNTLGLAAEFRSEKIPRNRLGTASVIPQKIVLIPRHSDVYGKVYSEARNGRKWPEKK
jgi:hypothetical protein